jgi:3-hydroxyacyl-[acyl-carrier protein] dehydratase/trans-2-decenoyl-[acyl-carrier protein] isomerase
VLPNTGLVTYTINIKKLIKRKLVVGVADGTMAIDDKDIYSAKDLRVGLFESTEGF